MRKRSSEGGKKTLCSFPSREHCAASDWARGQATSPAPHPVPGRPEVRPCVSGHSRSLCVLRDFAAGLFAASHWSPREMPKACSCPCTPTSSALPGGSLGFHTRTLGPRAPAPRPPPSRAVGLAGHTSLPAPARPRLEGGAVSCPGAQPSHMPEGTLGGCRRPTGPALPYLMPCFPGVLGRGRTAGDPCPSTSSLSHGELLGSVPSCRGLWLPAPFPVAWDRNK